MNRMISTICSLVIALVAVPIASAWQDVAIFGGHYFDMESGQFRENAGILIADGKFSAVNAKINVDESIPVIQLTPNQFILPGLIDCHAHYNVRLLRKRREEFLVMPIQYLANGVTVTFSCGEYAPEKMYQLRRDIEQGKKLGPRLLNSGPYFGRARPAWHADPQQVRQEVDAWSEKGVGGFKAKAIDPACLKALVEQAHKHGLTVTGHLDSGFRNSVNPRNAIEIGIDRIEHFLGGDAMPDDRSAYSILASIRPDMPEFKSIAQKFIDHKTVFDATITAYGYFGDRDGTDQTYAHWFDESSLFTDFVLNKIEEKNQRRPRRSMQQFVEIYKAKKTTIDDFFRPGGTITIGTDHVSDGTYLPGFGIHREMFAMASSGIPNADVLRFATINGARAFGIDDQHGSISVGKSGDLAIVTGNPLTDIKNTRNVTHVIKAGKVHDSQKLLASVRGKLGPTSEDQLDQW